MDSFLELAKEGKNDWWRYAISLALIFFLWFVLGSLPLLATMFLNGGLPFPDGLLSYGG
jgi:hypothetical protein